MRIMRINTPQELFDLVKMKVLKSRKVARGRMRNRCILPENKTFRSFEISEAPVEMNSLVPFNAFNAVISREDLRKLNSRNIDDLEHKDGKTTVANIIAFFFPPKKKK